MSAQEVAGKLMRCRATGQTFTLLLEASHYGARVEGQSTYVHPNCEGCGTKRKDRPCRMTN